MAALTEHFDGLATWTRPSVAFVPGAGFFADRVDHEHLRLSHSRIAEAEIEPAIARLAATVRRN
jgi:2-aminoadipate transaminase